jgi:type I restriction enzyme M protein
MRRKGEKSNERKGKVIFINANLEFRLGRAQAALYPEHIEKIVSVYRDFREVEDFSTIMTNEELIEGESNFHIPRYCDNTPLPEPQNVRAHLIGSIPMIEIDGKKPLFQSHRFDPMTIFVTNNDGSVDFNSGIADKRELRNMIASNGDMLACETLLLNSMHEWWKGAKDIIRSIYIDGTPLHEARSALMDSFISELKTQKMLTAFEVTGVIASWWDDMRRQDMRSLQKNGFYGLVDNWVTNIKDLVEAEESVNEHPLVRHLLANHLMDIIAKQRRVLEIKSAQKQEKEREDGDEPKFALDEFVAMKAEKSQLTRELRALKSNLMEALDSEIEGVSERIEDTALAIFKTGLERRLQEKIINHRVEVVSTLENWWDKYYLTLTEMEEIRNMSIEISNNDMIKMGYLREE